jgi:hypothetical protein
MIAVRRWRRQTEAAVGELRRNVPRFQRPVLSARSDQFVGGVMESFDCCRRGEVGFEFEFERIELALQRQAGFRD